MPILGIKERFNPLGALQRPKDGKIDEEKLKKASAEFESIFIEQLLKSMRQTVLKGGLFKEGSETEIYQSLFDQELSKSFAKQGRLGLGAMIYKQMVQPEDKKRPLPVELKALDLRRGAVSKETKE